MTLKQHTVFINLHSNERLSYFIEFRIIQNIIFLNLIIQFRNTLCPNKRFKYNFYCGQLIYQLIAEIT